MQRIFADFNRLGMTGEENVTPLGIDESANLKGHTLKVLLVERDLARWDEAFIANVARDRLLLWVRGGMTRCPSPGNTSRPHADVKALG